MFKRKREKQALCQSIHRTMMLLLIGVWVFMANVGCTPPARQGASELPREVPKVINSKPATQPLKPNERMFVDINGMTLGGGSGPPVPFLISLGDTPTQLMTRNPYLPRIGISPEGVFYAAIFRDFHYKYNDGDWRLDVPCVRYANYGSHKEDGSFVGMPGVQSTAGTLCEEIVDDWSRASRLAGQLASAFEVTNPKAQTYAQFAKGKSHAELFNISDRLVNRRNESKPIVLYSEAQANDYFAKEAEVGFEKLGPYNASRSVVTAKYVGEHAIFSIGISRGWYWGNRESIPVPRRYQMKYTVDFAIAYRKDAPQAR